MKNKLFAIIALAVSLVLLVAGIVLGLDRSSDIGGAYVMEVAINEEFDCADIEKIMIEAGATDAIVYHDHVQLNSGEYKAGENAVITFEIPKDATAQPIFEKAEKLLSEKYFLKFPGTISYLSATKDLSSLISLWPAAIVLVVLLAYAFVRFGVKTGVTALADMFIAVGATVGIMGIADIKLSSYTVGAVLLAAALAYMIVVMFAFVKKYYETRLDADEAYAVAVKQITSIAVVILALLAIAFALILILGGALLKSFALTVLIAVAFNMIAVFFVMPALTGNKKA